MLGYGCLPINLAAEIKANMQKPSAHNAAIGTTTAATSHTLGAVTQVTTKDPLELLAGEREKLELSAASLYGWLVIFSIIVAVGVILEFIEDAFEIFHAARKGEWLGIRKLFVFFGTLLVIVGVTGEFIFEAMVGENDGALRKKGEDIEAVLSDRLLAAAGVAQDRANTAQTVAGDAQRKAQDSKDALVPLTRQENNLRYELKGIDRELSEARDELAIARGQITKLKSETQQIVLTVRPRQLTGRQCIDVVRELKASSIDVVPIAVYVADVESFSFASNIMECLAGSNIKTTLIELDRPARWSRLFVELGSRGEAGSIAGAFRRGMGYFIPIAKGSVRPLLDKGALVVGPRIVELEIGPQGEPLPSPDPK